MEEWSNGVLEYFIQLAGAPRLVRFGTVGVISSQDHSGA
jgi:hypothetical protein